MIFILISFIAIILLVILMIILRKMQYDKTHVNLLDLTDQIGGKVIRKSFANQPVYQGVFNDKILQISFSKDKVGSQSVYYINFSMAISVRSTLTITSKKWLADMNEESNLNPENTKIIDGFVLRSQDNSLLDSVSNSAEILVILKQLEPFAYLLISPDGLLFDQQSNDILLDTQVKRMTETISNLSDLVRLSFNSD